ncbi:DUF1292 domain-containing protein [Clostridium sp. MSJ-11]|uniref:DUF1292 domain-containing protein n=1 Tax=Clostridium mobile TaxID=2841512 RepID=A0ABS6ED22_9CLOT|nr:DUF1292 domain-containing protein [Clostridium mobile]MBU5483093.1 DUF1292 domain-containing protein [Clostridium mobile]
MDKDELFDCGCEESTCGCEESDHGCGCGCEGHDHEALLVDLEDENGNTVTCEVVDGFEYKDNEYVLVQNPEDGSVYLFKVVGDEENSELVVPEDEEFDEVTNYYQTLTNIEE